MAVLTAAQLAQIRNGCERGDPNIAYTKAQINAALQAIENHFEADKPAMAADIEAAAPGVFNAAAKKRLVKHYLFLKFGLE